MTLTPKDLVVIPLSSGTDSKKEWTKHVKIVRATISGKRTNDRDFKYNKLETRLAFTPGKSTVGLNMNSFEFEWFIKFINNNLNLDTYETPNRPSMLHCSKLTDGSIIVNIVDGQKVFSMRLNQNELNHLISYERHLKLLLHVDKCNLKVKLKDVFYSYCGWWIAKSFKGMCYDCLKEPKTDHVEGKHIDELHMRPEIIVNEISIYKDTILKLFQNVLDVMLLSEAEKSSYLDSIKDLFNDKEMLKLRVMSICESGDQPDDHMVLQLVNNFHAKE